uniref:Uncharacterized protein n=1 Tax=Mesocestoides corti TaxID=53468 RepID=A0A5K3ESF6_MESCO
MKKTVLTEQALLTKRQVPSIRVFRAACAVHYISLLKPVPVSLAAYIPSMPLELKDNGLAEASMYQVRLRPYIRRNTSQRFGVKYPRPSMKKSGTTQQDSLTNQKLATYIRRRPSESTMLATALILSYTPFMSFSG